ncbi:MAG TPA: 4a-hydroxytetrahydrobiopterin dehydratase [Caldimonas sp.]|jgi:4a-hydroxytetrahydrobiopterin dehydratase|nr:4a-hydroxytetrahydrobiopterin dehydratase [Caldimonas sp.]HEX2540598.1 4a-hydroxytetrahydrobiopterin dehydratase [Caldimonas sp.]
MTHYLEKRCEQRAAPMSDAAVRDHLAQSSGWRQSGNGIEKTFAFKGWLETVAFVDALAWVCHVEDHHPDLQVSYDRCVVRFSTHSAGGISMNDFICAAKTDALVAFVG